MTRRRAVVALSSGIGVALLFLVLPGIALADNCSSLSDWGTAGGAASAAAGAAVGAPSEPPRDHYPVPGPGEPTGDDAAVKRVRDYYRDVHEGKRSPRTAGDAWEDLVRVAPKLDLDEESRKWYEETVRKFPTDRAIRG